MVLQEYSEEDVGNILLLEHVNLGVPDQGTATLFYVVGLGLTRDPYLSVSVENMWINAGEQQFHLPTRAAQVVPGHIGVVVPSLKLLEARLESVRERLSGTGFGWTVKADHLEISCPWGNQLRCYEPSPEFGSAILGIPYVELRVRPGSADGIARFYLEALKAPATVYSEGGARVARVSVGCNQWLSFREWHGEIPPYDGHHIAIYIADFSGPYGFLKRRAKITEVRRHQFRFQEVLDPRSEETLLILEHEVRSLRHPMYRRFLINREPTQIQRNYRRGRDSLNPFGF
ncbi:MAG: hypothetical protein HY695_27930 [Deltaproteobacteria bacterium]|nr:hypothetical protein [Deltaproteobacteria bacterium]